MMEIKIRQIKDIGVAELISDQVEITTTQDALDIMMNCVYQGADNIIVQDHHLTPAFFDLKTKVAGDILQKFSTYGARLAIIGDFSDIQHKSLRDFIYESNKTGRVSFVGTMEEAIEKLAKR